MANLLSATRLALAFPFAMLMYQSIENTRLGDPNLVPALAAALLFGFAILSDLFDGPLARAAGTASDFGRVLDHLADFAFVSAGLGAAAAQGELPWLLPALVALAFAQYVADSLLAHGQPGLRPSALGRINGVLYFAPPGGVLLVQLGLGWLAGPTLVLGWVLVVTTVVSMAQRLRATPSLRSRRTARAARASGRPARSRR